VDNEKLLQLIQDLKGKLKERDTKHSQITRQATTEIVALKRQIATLSKQNDQGQLISVISHLQSKIANLQDELKELGKAVTLANIKEDPKEEDTEDIQHIEVDKDGDTTYVGRAKPDSSFDKAVWCIQRVRKNGTKVSVEVVEDATWSKRKGETYA